MAFDFLRKWLFENALKNALASNAPTTKGKIGVFFNLPADPGEIDRLLEVFRKKGLKSQDISFLVYVPDKLMNPIDLPHYTPKEINWSRYASNEAVNNFVGTRFDRFYFLCPVFENHHRFILAQVVAALKAGVFSPGVESFLDLTLDRSFVSASQSLKDIEDLIYKLTSHAK
ncbi:MAG: hypothetical protein IPN29_19440 [Saprospiraceae bacterium]|nr:hypothetical protein [Saprospiraceae bacterium]